MRSFSDLRATARQSLRGKWFTAVVICIAQGVILNGLSVIKQLISTSSSTDFVQEMTEFILSEGTAPIPNLGGVYFGSAILSFLSFAITFLLGGVMTYGLAACFLRIARNKPTAVGDLFEGFNKFLSCFLTFLLVSIFSILWSIPVMIVMLIVIFALTFIIISSGSVALGVILGFLMVLVIIACIVVLSVILARYALVYYLIKDSQETDAMNYIKQSKEMMKGRAWNYFLLGLSFIGWYLLSIITCGLASLGVTPYVYATYTEFYLDVLAEERAKGTINLVTLVVEDVTDEDFFQGQF